MSITKNNKIILILLLGGSLLATGCERKIFSPEKYAPCATAPPGMVCIPGGKAVIGKMAPDQKEPIDTTDPEKFAKRFSLNRKFNPAKRIMVHWQTYDSYATIGNPEPAYIVDVDTFYMDKYEVTNKEYWECVKAGACENIWYFNNKLYNGFRGDKQAAVPITWKRAHQYCKWAGKRLPTEAEWEKVARGGMKATTYPWGNEPPDCKKANYQGCNATILDVGKYPAGHYGVHDMAANGFEWVNDWASDCREGCDNACGSACLGKNPLGPCGGKNPCGDKTIKMLKGGSWFWPPDETPGYFRRLEKIESKGNRLSFRCASDTPILSNNTGWMIQNPPAPLPPLEKPDPETIQTIHRIETDTLDKPHCDSVGWSSNECKDPTSYIITNEYRHYQLAPYAKNLGGAYVGVAAEANYSLIAHAQSRYAWLFDFDIVIVRLHMNIKALVKMATNRQEFIRFFAPGRSEEVHRILAREYPGHPDMDGLKGVYDKFREKLYEHYQSIAIPDAAFGDYGWLRNDSAYQYIRTMFLQDRIVIIPGDMLKDKTMRSIAAAARKINIPIRIYYPSDAEEHYVFNDSYKKNVTSLPFDDASIAIRSIWQDVSAGFGVKFPGWHQPTPGIYWHYVIHGAPAYQKKIVLPDYRTVDDWRGLARKTEAVNLSTIELPGSLPPKLATELNNPQREF